ncbi:hypothetical protein [Streptomyces katsurahamanus]|uniref:Uncharacterized protein n=1 Tax=Streptomyces katsurahamanus TaxID=2577098 RepID=A0ABW9NME9_9ACTN|nr:hypothetical protein [Streptomyces katsurahamanus]MQS34486.1 hypothetical protein [Streptomyces katsurahamanus]
MPEGPPPNDHALHGLAAGLALPGPPADLLIAAGGADVSAIPAQRADPTVGRIQALLARRGPDVVATRSRNRGGERAPGAVSG